MKKSIIVGLIAVLSLIALPAMADVNSDSDSNSQLSQGPINSYNKSTGRSFVHMGEFYNPGMPGFIGQVPRGYAYQELEELFMYKLEYNQAEVGFQLKNKKYGKLVLPRPVVDVDAVDKEKLFSSIAIVVDANGAKNGKATKLANVKQYLGTITVAADSLKSISADVAAATLDEAFSWAEAVEDGQLVIQFTQQGVERKQHSSGWGFGFGGVTGTVSESGKSSSVGQFGTGYNRGTGFQHDHPYVQAHVLILAK